MRRSSPILPTTTRPVLSPMRICRARPRCACSSSLYARSALHAQRRVHGPAWTILVGHRSTEQGHHPIPGILVNRAFETVHLRGDQLEAAIDDLVHLLRVERLGQSREASHVGEQDSNLAAFAF